MLPVYKSFVPSSSIKHANKAVRSSWISSIGEYIDLATLKLKEFSGCKYVVLTNNGTAATHLVVRSLKRFKPEVRRVLVPSACYAAAYNSLIYDQNDWDVSCIDLDEDTWNMKIKRIEKDDAIFAVHNLGNIINVPRLSKEYKCPIIEDNCEGFFGLYENFKSGSQSICSSLSFFGNKNITCGEGGAFLTNDEEIYRFALKLRGQGQTEKKYIHDELGYNYRMTNVQAAILLGQLENIPLIHKNKQRVFERYRDNLANIKGISIQEQEEDTAHSMWMFGCRFDNLESYRKAELYFSKNEIDTRPMFYSYKNHKHLNFTGSDNIARKLNKQIVIFPSYPELKDDEIDYVCEQIIDFNNSLR